MRARSNIFTLDGIPLGNLAMSAPYSYDLIHLAPQKPYMPERREIAVSFHIMAYDHERAYLEPFHRMVTSGCRFSLTTLGPGRVCAYCGQYNPSGRLSCFACAGQIETVPFLKPVQWPDGFVIELDRRGGLLGDEEPAIWYVEMSLRGDLDPERHIEPLLASGRLNTMQHGYRLQGGWLCEWCGFLVEGEDVPCPTCGGEQMPWSELVKIDRECVYCGKHVPQGLVCDGCGASLSGLTYRMVNGKGR